MGIGQLGEAVSANLWIEVWKDRLEVRDKLFNVWREGLKFAQSNAYRQRASWIFHHVFQSVSLIKNDMLC